jgi:hypothetical protein
VRHRQQVAALGRPAAPGGPEQRARARVHVLEPQAARAAVRPVQERRADLRRPVARDVRDALERRAARLAREPQDALARRAVSDVVQPAQRGVLERQAARDVVQPALEPPVGLDVRDVLARPAARHAERVVRRAEPAVARQAQQPVALGVQPEVRRAAWERAARAAERDEPPAVAAGAAPVVAVEQAAQPARQALPAARLRASSLLPPAPTEGPALPPALSPCRSVYRPAPH